jgi:hypothetical protein
MKKKVTGSGLFLMFILLLTSCKKDDLKQCWTDGHCYEAVLAPVSWYEAKAAFENPGGYLVTITPEQEHEFVFKLVKRNTFWYLDTWGNGLGPWIGDTRRMGHRRQEGMAMGYE